jgi:hypothetical protein
MDGAALRILIDEDSDPAEPAIRESAPPRRG